MKPYALYIHIPFCLHKCAYCDFNSVAAAAVPEKDYVAALLAELDHYAALPEWRDRPVSSIYIGGGTPSLFSSGAIARLLNAVIRTTAVDELVEITLEANPGTVTFDRLLGYREAGVNRVSFGAQSFNRKLLSFLGRIHAPHHIEESVAYAKAAGFQNISLDLIYGVPRQSLQDLRHDLKELLRLAPAHISAYSLTLEKGTRLYKAFRKGDFELPRETDVIRQIQELVAQLSFNGYQRYEISNFARRGREARHNLSYWNGDDYLGLGAGAHSFLAAPTPTRQHTGTRWANTAAPDKYMEQAADTGRAAADTEGLSFKEAAFEFFLLGLRKLTGVNLKDFERRFGLSVDEVYPGVIKLLLRGGFVKLDGCRLSLAPKGLLVADSVMESFAAPKIGRLELPEAELPQTGGAGGQLPLDRLPQAANTGWKL